MSPMALSLSVVACMETCHAVFDAVSLVCAVAMSVPNAASGTGGFGKFALPVSAVLRLLQVCTASPSGTPLRENFTFAMFVLLVATFTAPADVGEILLLASKTIPDIPNIPTDAPDLNLDASETFPDASKPVPDPSNVMFDTSKPASDASEPPFDAPKPAFDVSKTISDASKTIFYASKARSDAPDSTATDWQKGSYAINWPKPTFWPANRPFN